MIRSKFGSFDKYHSSGGPGCPTLTKMCRGEYCDNNLALRSAKLLGAKFTTLFREEKQTEPLSANTIHHYHNMISMILAQAEREMIVPFQSQSSEGHPQIAELHAGGRCDADQGVFAAGVVDVAGCHDVPHCHELAARGNRGVKMEERRF